MIIYKKRCQKCSYKWNARVENPRQCPNCKRQLNYIKVLDKEKTREITREFVRKGILIKKSCKKCGDLKVHAHHSDYSKTLKVIWLCKKHHREWHKKNGFPVEKAIKS